MAAGVEKKFSQRSYTGENRNLTFEKYATLHKEHHNILDSIKYYGYIGIEQRYKVKYRSKGTKKNIIDLVNTRIMLDESLRQYFDGCVTLYK